MVSKQLASSSMQKLMKGDRHKFSTSDSNVMVKQIQATHAPDGREFDVKPLLSVVEGIFFARAAAAEKGPEAHVEDLDDHQTDHSAPAGFNDMAEAVAYIIDRISCEIMCKCYEGGEAYGTTMSVLNMVTSYSWDAKMVLALAAFALTYGNLLLVAQLHASNKLAKSVAVLKQVPPVILEQSNSMLSSSASLSSASASEHRLDVIIMSLFKDMLDVTKYVIAFCELEKLPPRYTEDIPQYITAVDHVIPIAAYWTIRNVVACASHFASLSGVGLEYMSSTMESLELSSLVGTLHDQLDTCKKRISEKKHMEASQALKSLFGTITVDIMDLLSALIHTKDDQQSILDGATKKRFNIGELLERLKDKYVLLLISDIEISNELLDILKKIYNESFRTKKTYEVVWLPIQDQSNLIHQSHSTRNQFENMRAAMPWYSLHHPATINRVLMKKFNEEVWSVGKKPILVVLDPQGRVACPNALHMICIWKSKAFPFTLAREEALWITEDTWSFEFLVNDIDPLILNWISERKYICLYGGEDMEWIRKFTTAARGVAQAAGISLGMVYVGKSNPKKRVEKNIATIFGEKLSHCLQDLASVKYFWVRIESMWQSKVQQNKTVENDSIMQEVMRMMSLDGSEGGWALLSRGSEPEIIKAKGTTFLTCLSQYDLWKENVKSVGFMQALKEHLLPLHPPHHCNRLVLPDTHGKNPEAVVCSECGRTMETFIMYECCDEFDR